MSIMAMALPILPGKTPAWRSWISELNGPRHEEFVASRSRAGVHERTFLQETPKGDVVIVTLEGTDPAGSFQTMTQANDAFTTWFLSQAKEVHGIDIPSPLQHATQARDGLGGRRRRDRRLAPRSLAPVPLRKPLARRAAFDCPHGKPEPEDRSSAGPVPVADLALLRATAAAAVARPSPWAVRPGRCKVKGTKRLLPGSRRAHQDPDRRPRP